MNVLNLTDIGNKISSEIGRAFSGETIKFGWYSSDQKNPSLLELFLSSYHRLNWLCSLTCRTRGEDVWYFLFSWSDEGRWNSNFFSNSKQIIKPFLFFYYYYFYYYYFFYFYLISDEVKIFSFDSEWIFYDVFAPLRCWGLSETSESIYKTIIEESEILNPCRIVNKQPFLLCY